MTQDNTDLMQPLVDAHLADLRKEAATHQLTGSAHPIRTAIGQRLITLGERLAGVRPPSAPSIARERVALQ